jgi:glycosyltransferase 2 family protein
MSNYAQTVIGRKRSLLAILVSVAILAILARKVDLRLNRVLEQMRSVRWSILLATFAFSAAWHAFVGTDKWRRILRALGADVAYGEVLRVRLGSDPIRFATPFKLGEVVNAVYFSRLEPLGFSRAAGSIAFDKAMNFFGTLFWLYVGVVAMSAIPTAGHIALHTCMGGVILLLISVRPLREFLRKIASHIHPKIGRLATGVLAAFEEFSFGRKIGFLAYGVVFQIRPLVICYLLFVAFGTTRMPSSQEFLAFGSMAVLMANIPLTVAGFGPREATIIALFSAYASAATLLSVGVLMSFSIHVVPALIGIPFMFPLLKAIAGATAVGTIVPSGPEAGPAAISGVEE